MTHLDPSRLPACWIKLGDTRDTLNHNAREFCISISGKMDENYIKSIFGQMKDNGLVETNRRFVPASKLSSEPLIEWGLIDAVGRLITESWNIDDHELCKEFAWRYQPRSVPDGLSSALKDELKNFA